MTTRSPTALVEELARLAGRAEPPPLADADARRLVDLALASSPAARSAHRPRAIAGAFGLAAAAALLWLAVRTPARPAEPSILRVTLPTGDRLVGVAGARFDVERLAPADRRLRLRAGTVLFDVAHVVAGQRFQVATDHLVAIAKGTVFSVEVDPAGSRVRVYQGIVDVEQDGRSHDLAAGAVWDSRTRTTAITFARPPALAASVASVLRERAAMAASAPPPTTSARALTASAPPPTTSARALTASAPPPTTDARALTASAPPPIASAPPPAAIVAGSAPAAAERPRAAALDRARDDARYRIARAALVAGRLEAALATAHLALASPATASGRWWQLAGDASRGLGRAADAADAFDRAARTLTGADAIAASYTAAYVRFHDLLDGEAALASLAGADADGSPLAERALGLRAQILAALGRRDAARTVAAEYLARFPRADLCAYMRALVRR